MKIELEPQDIEAITLKVEERLKPFLVSNYNDKADDTIFDVKGIARYLCVKTQWIYENVHNNEIPHYKMGKHLRFRKSKIDEWLQKKEKGNIKKPANTVRRLLEGTG